MNFEPLNSEPRIIIANHPQPSKDLLDADIKLSNFGNGQMSIGMSLYNEGLLHRDLNRVTHLGNIPIETLFPQIIRDLHLDGYLNPSFLWQIYESASLPGRHKLARIDCKDIVIAAAWEDIELLSLTDRDSFIHKNTVIIPEPKEGCIGIIIGSENKIEHAFYYLHVSDRDKVVLSKNGAQLLSALGAFTEDTVVKTYPHKSFKLIYAIPK